MEKQEGKGKGSFWLRKKVINSLIESATVTQICAYLILARYTDSTGQFSTCGMTGVKRALGLGDNQARQALASLDMLTVEIAAGKKTTKQRMVHSADQWAELTGEVFEAHTVKAKIRFVLSHFDAENEDGERVWFPNTLVDGYGQFSQPLKRLKRLGEVAARLLMVMYRENNMEQFGGVAPSVMYADYTSEKQVRSEGYQLWHSTFNNPVAFTKEILEILKLKKYSAGEEGKRSEVERFFSAHQALVAGGFIYEVISVLDNKPGTDDANVVYELDVKTRHGYKPRGEEGLAGDTARLAGFWGKSVADPSGRFNGTYAAIIEEGVDLHVAGIYRLRFRVANPKNHTVKQSFQRIHQGQTEWKEILSHLLAPYKLPTEPTVIEVETKSKEPW